MKARYGLIGAGMMGQEHIRNVQLLENAEVAAICDPHPSIREAAGRLCPDASQFENSADLAAEDPCDAYIVASPNDTHHAILLDLIPLGKPLLVEKPLCTSSSDCRNAIQFARRAGLPVWVAMEYRYMPPVQRLIDEIKAGTTGTPKMMSVREHRFPFLPKVGNWNRFNRRTGGTFVEKCCHFWDLMRLILESDPVRVYASGAIDVNHRDERYDGETPDMIDNAYAVVDFASGARAMLDLCMFAEGSQWQETISITGPKARADACIPGPARFMPDREQRHARIEISERATKKVTVEEVEVDETILAAGDHHGATFYQHQRFCELVRSGNGEPEVSLEDGLWAVLVGEACEKSARTGEAVELESLSGTA